MDLREATSSQTSLSNFGINPNLENTAICSEIGPRIDRYWSITKIVADIQITGTTHIVGTDPIGYNLNQARVIKDNETILTFDDPLFADRTSPTIDNGIQHWIPNLTLPVTLNERSNIGFEFDFSLAILGGDQGGIGISIRVKLYGFNINI